MVEAFPVGGYHRKLLRVNLSKEKIQKEALPPELLKEYIGGTGLGIRLLYDEVPRNTGAMSPENRLIFSTGPLTGTLVPGSGTISVMAKSPLTGFAASAQANGYLGARLKAAGFDAVVIEGRAKKPVYLHIQNRTLKILPAEFLKNKGAFDVDRILRKRHGENGYERRISVAGIGPAGEHLVRFAAICCDRGHMAASGGLGAVMGAKNVKALVVEGDGPVPIAGERIDAFKQAVSTWRQEAGSTAIGKLVHEKGTLGFFTSYHAKGWVPVKNLTTNLLSEDDLKEFNWEYIRKDLFQSVPRVCHACTFNHCHIVRVKKGPYKGVIGEEPEYEILAGFGSNWGIHDAGAVTMLNTLNDDLGMDGKEASFLVSMLMEGYEKRLITKDDLDGISLSWGNVEGVGQLLKKISRREGIGDLLAEGIVRTARELGGEFEQMAVYVKQGNAPHIHDSRTRWGTLFTQIISNTASQEGMDMTARANPELGFTEPTSEPTPYLATVQAKTGPKRQFEECLLFCYFQACSLKTMVHTLNVLTGGDYTPESCLEVGQRVINLLRMFNYREGLTIADDSYSPRLGQSPLDGPGRGKSITPTFEEIRRTYYQEMDWDDRGIPKAEILKRLNLDFTLSDL